jgi:flagellar basal body-associated protein FliL
MLYLLQIYLLVAVPVFALAGAFILALFVSNKVQEYAQARRAMKRIVTGNRFQYPRTLGAA